MTIKLVFPICESPTIPTLITTLLNVSTHGKLTDLTDYYLFFSSLPSRLGPAVVEDEEDTEEDAEFDMVEVYHRAGKGV